jgi:hypothetical protein
LKPERNNNSYKMASTTGGGGGGGAAPAGESLLGDEPATKQGSVDAKILRDLEFLTEKMEECGNLLRPGGGGDLPPEIRKSEALLAKVGFLEACAPRMVELVEAGAVGALSEPVLMRCLEANDRLTNLLSDIDRVNFTEAAASSAPAAAGGGGRTDEDDAAASGAAQEAPSATRSEDAFDDFLNERTSGGGGF